MATSVLIPIDEYLKTSYRPDREYVDGEVVGRNMESGNMQGFRRFLQSDSGNTSSNGE